MGPALTVRPTGVRPFAGVEVKELETIDLTFLSRLFMLHCVI